MWDARSSATGLRRTAGSREQGGNGCSTHPGPPPIQSRRRRIRRWCRRPARPGGGVRAGLDQPRGRGQPVAPPPGDRSARESPAPARWPLLIEDALDEGALTRLRRIVRSEGARAVLVVGAIRESELLDVVECGVGAIVWRHEATAHRLVQVVLGRVRGDGDLPADLLGRLISQVGTLHRGAAGRPGALAGSRTPRGGRPATGRRGPRHRRSPCKLSYSNGPSRTSCTDSTTRLHLRNRAHAVAYALREGYI
ncbi:DNA-binding response regulator [Streptomyces thinghirensis]|nr:DNA-binding response regulator [Streptomyces thinghirensis]